VRMRYVGCIGYAVPRYVGLFSDAVGLYPCDMWMQCAICRNSLNEPSIQYQANPSPTNDAGLSIAFGNCGHVFHRDCIQCWLKKKSTCPRNGTLPRLSASQGMDNLDFDGISVISDAVVCLYLVN
jgi:RING-H2 zinc finger domain